MKPKRLISFALTVALMFGIFSGMPGVNFFVSAETTYTGLIGWTAISDRTGLEAMKNNLSGKYYLTKDIDLSGSEWIPVGNSNYSAFRGIFDGQGYIISNLKITGNFEYNGLFGYAENAVIKNVRLERTNINIAASFDIYAGGICGYGNNAEILNSYASGNISAAGSCSYIGGLIGFSNGTVENCYSFGDISGYSEGTNIGSTGGLAGAAKGIIKNCYAANNVAGNLNNNAGGLVGECGGSLEITNCYAIGNVVAYSSDSSIYAGGLIGRSRSYTPVVTEAVITNCYRLSSQSITGGGIINQRGTPLDDSQMKQKSSFAGFDFDKAWGIDEEKSYPYLGVFVINISISRAAGTPGKDISVYAEITNNPGIAAYKLIVSYDASKLDYVGGKNETVVGAGGLLKLQSINDDKINGRVVVVAANDSDVTDDGLLFTLKFQAKAGVPLGDYPIILAYEENHDIKNEKNTPVNPRLTNGGINIVKIMRGDANGDGSVDVGDLICLARHFAEIAFITDSVCLEMADANNDDELNIADLISLARHIAEIELLPDE